MGKDFLDEWSIGHFIGGIAARISVFPNNKLLSFFLTVTTHLMIELAEKNPHPKTNSPESFENHVGDMLFFILGWIFGDCIDMWVPNEIRPTILVAFIYTSISELLREFIY